MRYVRVHYSNGDSIETSINGTDKELKKYFAIGKKFNIGSGAKDKIVTVKKLEILE